MHGMIDFPQTAFDFRAVLPGLALGLVLGLLASGLFFSGLAVGIRRALRSPRPMWILLFSFVCRVAMLVGLALWLIRVAHPLWSPAAYMLAFFIVRMLVLRRARSGVVAVVPGPARRS